MPEPTQYEFWPDVAYRMFVLIDPAHPEDPLSTGTPDLDRLTHAGPGGVVFGTAGNDFQPLVRLEVRPSPPPPAGQAEWDMVEEADLQSVSGTLRIVSVHGTGHLFSLGPPGIYRVRAHCRGRAQAAQRIGVELFYRGIEEWLIQIWASAR